MVALVAEVPFTEAEYLALEAVSETRHEFSGGRILGMAGAELAHNQVVQNVRMLLGNALLNGPCRVLGSDQRVKVEATQEYYYPDALVTCLEPRLTGPKPESLLNPQIIVEVLSGSTRGYDRADKWLAYRTIPTLTDYVLISSTAVEWEHYQRAADGTWSSHTVPKEGASTLSGGVTLQTQQLYRLVSGI